MSNLMLGHRILAGARGLCWVIVGGVGGCTMGAIIANDDAGTLIANDDAGSGGAATGGAGSGGGGGSLTDAQAPDLVLLADGGLLSNFCEGFTVETEPTPVVLELVVDVSGSMNEPPPDNSQTKWELTRTALGDTVASLPPFAATGVLFYPNKATPANTEAVVLPPPCIETKDNVTIGPLGDQGSPQRVAIDAAFAKVLPVSGAGTPTHDAYVLALQEIKATTYAGDRFLLLITDGVPTFSLGCFGSGTAELPPLPDPAPIIAEIANAAASGIRTFVVGSPGSEDSRPWLSAAARAGGTPPRTGCSDEGPLYCHYDMTVPGDFGEVLSQGLRNITSSMISCTYNVPSNDAVDLDRVNVVYTQADGAEYLVAKYVVPKNGADNCERGWHYINLREQIEICGETCNKIREDGAARIDVAFGCREENIPTVS